MNLIPLDATHGIKSSHFILDYRVAVWQLLYSAHENIEKRWELLFNELAADTNTECLSLTVVDDRKDDSDNYWRQHWINSRRQGFKYKGGRKAKPSHYADWYEGGLEVAEKLGIQLLSYDGLEADDWAGGLCRKHENLLLCTVDLDWLQLVDDEKQIQMYCMGNFNKHSNLKDEAEALNYYLQKDITITHPREVVELKMIEGDAGDNLAPGSSRELIDLLDNPLANFVDLKLSSFEFSMKFKPDYSTAFDLRDIMDLRPH